MFLDDIDISEIADRVTSRNNKATLWDLLVEIFAKKGKVESFVIWILSDLPVIELTARGHGAQYIADFLEMSLKEVLTTCKIWGIIPNKETLDFDPYETYVRGMSPSDFRSRLKPFLAVLPPYEIFEDLIINVEKYIRIKELLDQWIE